MKKTTTKTVTITEVTVNDDAVHAPGTIGALLASLPQFADKFDSVDPAILELLETDGCGHDCANIIRIGAALIAASGDVDDTLRSAIFHQLAIFYFG